MCASRSSQSDLFEQSIKRATELWACNKDKAALRIEDEFFAAAHSAPLPHSLGFQTRQIFVKELANLRVNVTKELSNQTETSVIYAIADKGLRTLLLHMLETYMSVVGSPPHTYNILLLGSIAGQEATPWSDVEMVVLCPEGAYQPSRYFVQLSQWLAFSFLAFGETPFNGLGRNGFRLDKTKNPLGPHGRGTHIQTPNMMAARQKKADHQHEPNYHLSGSLLFSDSLCGHAPLFDQYKKAVIAILDMPGWYSENATRRVEFARYQYHRALETANHFSASVVEHANVKDLYRDFQLLLSSLSLLYGFFVRGLKEQVRTLENHSLLPAGLRNTLAETVDFVLRLRLQTYVHYQQQIHTIYWGTKAESNKMLLIPADVCKLQIAYHNLALLWSYASSEYSRFANAAKITRWSSRASLMLDIAVALPHVLASLPFDSRSGDALADHASKLPSIIAVLENAEYLRVNPEATIDGFTRVAHKIMQLDQYDKAHKMLTKAHTMLELHKHKDITQTILIANVLRYQGRLGFMTQKDPTLSLKSLQKAVMLWLGIIAKLTSESSATEKLADATLQLHLAQSDMAKLLIDIGQLEKAKEILYDMLSKANKFQQYNCYTFLGRIAFLQGKLNQAKRHLDLAIEILDELNGMQQSKKQLPLRNVDALLYRAELFIVHGDCIGAISLLDKVENIFQKAIRQHNPYAAKANIHRWFLKAKVLKQSSEAKVAAQHSRAMAGVVYGAFPKHPHRRDVEAYARRLEISDFATYKYGTQAHEKLSIFRSSFHKMHAAESKSTIVNLISRL